MNNNLHKHVVAFQLRALVLALGEASRPAWWKTEFMNETGIRFLERLFPRTSIRAAIHAAGKAACEVHDRAAGRIRVYHLFRLPESLEAEIHSLSDKQYQQFNKNFRVSLGSPKSLLKMLNQLCNGQSKRGKASGPIRIGSESEATRIEFLKEIGTVYHDAFQMGKMVFPYFTN